MKIHLDTLLTEKEHQICEDAGVLFMNFMKLEQLHPSDAGDVCFHIHAIQSIVMGRAAQRAFPDRYPIKTSVCLNDKA